jgi:polygalacturonase
MAVLFCHLVLILLFVSWQGALALPCDVRDYGAVGDGYFLNTVAINAAIANSSCDVIQILDGVYRTGELEC